MGAGLFGFPANINLPKTQRDGLIVSAGIQAMDRLRLSGDYSYMPGTARGGIRVPGVAEQVVLVPE